MTVRADAPSGAGSVKRAGAANSRTWAWGRRSVVGLAVVLAVAGLLAHKIRASRRADALPVLFSIDPFSLVDQHGQKVALADLRGKIWVADFIFTGCQMACPMLTSRMRSLQTYLEERERKLGRELPIRLVSFSVDPEVDTPEKLSAYAARFGADDRRWLFLTGSLAEINRAVTGSMKIPFEKEGKSATGATSAFDVMHGEHFVVVDGQGRIRGYFDSDPDGIHRVENALEELASAEKSAP
jgi:protein SCO1/2